MRAYDQVAFFPGTTHNCFTGKKGVFDYHQVLFPHLYKDGKGTNLTNFKTYCRYHISDHRPMWVELNID